jgi:ribosomal protein S18 acetylase RimI-like enzyme
MKGRCELLDINAAQAEFQEYLDKGYPIYCYMEAGEPLGYVVCRVEGGIVWCESLYVMPRARRRGIASALFQEAEKLAESLGESMVYNNVHPNNHRIIAFLQKQGYDVLNLIEIRKAYPGESPQPGFVVGEHSFRY